MVDTHTLVRDLCSTANYLSLNLLYAKRYIAPGEPIAGLDVREFCPGHWGCVTGLNFIWANLVGHAAGTLTRVVPLIGTGHGGAAWVAWSLIERAGQLSRAELDDAILQFGDDDTTPHELFGPLPGLVWPSGELGYALGIAQGSSPELEERVAAVVGDGELETGCTLSALAAGPMLKRPPLLVVNANGFRMGGASWFASLPDHGREYFLSLGWTCQVVHEGDIASFQAALGLNSDKPCVIVYLNKKGGVIPPFPGANSPSRPVHKLPSKELSTEHSRCWLRSWLDSFETEALTDSGVGNMYSETVIGSTSSLASARSKSRIGNHQKEWDSQVACTTPKYCVEVVIDELVARQSDALMLCPDEAASNLVNHSSLEVREFLSEQLTFAWAIGAAAVGRASVWVTYEAFAPIVFTMLAQYARHLERSHSSTWPRGLPVLVVTSLSLRNVPSHQDVGFCSDVERRGLALVTILVPHTTAFAAEAARLSIEWSTSAKAIPIVYVEKYPISADALVAGLQYEGLDGGWLRYRFCDAGTVAAARVAIVALGAVQFGEALRAARYIADNVPSVECDVVVLWIVGAAASQGLRLSVGNILGGYTFIAAIAGLESRTWTQALAQARCDGRLIHEAVFTPTAGPNDVVRLLRRELDWLAVVIAVTRALRADDVADRVTAARVRLRDQVEQARTARWYHEKKWESLLSLLGLDA